MKEIFKIMFGRKHKTKCDMLEVNRFGMNWPKDELAQNFKWK
jgi:hypothetical protein